MYLQPAIPMQRTANCRAQVRHCVVLSLVLSSRGLNTLVYHTFFGPLQIFNLKKIYS